MSLLVPDLAATRFVLALVAFTAPVPPFATARVPAIVIVPLPVIGPPEVVRPVVPPDTSTDVTVPVPAAAHVPSPRQNVDALALVPLFRLVTGRFPVTPVVKGSPVALVKVPLEGVPSTPPFTTNAPADPTAMPRAVTTPVPVVVVTGAPPAPPPSTIALATRAVEDAQVEVLEKYGMPPEAPATVRASVPLAVIGEPETVIRPPVNDCATEVTVPVPATAHVPSPRQKVDALALVPLFKLVTGKLPVTPVPKGNPVALDSVPLDGVPSTPPFTTNAPADPTATPRAVTTPVPVVVVAGAPPAPPPSTIALATRAMEDAHVEVLEKYGTPPEAPTTVNASVPLVVTGEPATDIRPPVND
jgi:hypothetical protein